MIPIYRSLSDHDSNVKLALQYTSAQTQLASSHGGVLTLSGQVQWLSERYVLDAILRFCHTDSINPEQSRTFRGDTLELKTYFEFPDNIELHGAEWYMFHRADLHNELRRLAELPSTEFGEGYGPPAKIWLDSEVTSETDIENGVICLKSGGKLKKDLIIAADGVHVCFLPTSTLDYI